MAIYHNGSKIISLYRKGKKIESVYHNGIKIYSSLLPVGTSAFNDTNFVIDKNNDSGSVGKTYHSNTSGNVYNAITLKYPLSKYKNGIEINFNESIASFETMWDWDHLGFLNNSDLSIEIPKSSSEVSYYLYASAGVNLSCQGNITISINGQKLTMTHIWDTDNDSSEQLYPVISSITAY